MPRPGGNQHKKQTLQLFNLNLIRRNDKWTLSFWLKLLVLSAVICGGFSTKCYKVRCTKTNRSDCVAKETECDGKYCYKADGKTKDGIHYTKKGCLKNGSPGPCKNETIRLPGTDPMEGHWCVCDSDWCNGSEGLVHSQSITLKIRNHLLLAVIPFALLQIVYRFLNP